MPIFKNIMKSIFTTLTITILCIFSYENSAIAATNFVKTDQAEITLIAGEYSGGKALLALNFKLQPGWHIYWRIAGDTGFPPTLEWTGSANTNSSEFMWPVPTRLRQEIQPNNFLESYVYEDDVTFPIRINAKNPEKPIDIAMRVSYAICAETCIPGDATLSLNLQPDYKSTENLKEISSAMDKLSQENGAGGLKIESVTSQKDASGKYSIEVKTSSIRAFSKDATIFIDGGSKFGFYNPKAEISGKTAIFTVLATPLADKKNFSGMPLFVTLVNGKDAVNLTVDGNKIDNMTGDTPLNSNAGNGSTGMALLLTMIAFAFIGGLILNVMPCVLPILSIKLLGVIKHGGGKKHEVTESFLITALGILTSFFIFALITIWLKEAGDIVGWGLHFQQPYFIITLVVILTLFAANMWGFYEININIPVPQSQKGWIEHFMTGMLATVLATPCTAPFLGVAVGFAVTRGTFEILTIFISMGLGLAFPYLLFSFFPDLVTRLPKPGHWMITIKKIMSILLAVSAVWLIWVLSNQIGRVSAIILLLLCITKVVKLWAANHYKFIHKIKIPLIIFTIILCFIIPIKVSDKVENKAEQASHEMWEDFRPEDISKLVANGKVVFVDVTADWCLTCKVNKLTVLEREGMKDEFAKRGVVAMQADWTNRDSSIAKYLMLNKRAGIPFNIVYGPGAPDGIILSEILTAKDVVDALQKAGGK